ncbi:hypothetical protein FHS27_005068 [Rhodopirellula rubra]|uniref:Uncharacterized protein n=1 Tax=Aporhodopirellula rubra TaxID=980271 RepID=A0A7W5H8M3_9BACT|nr:hypothetical protein [Aporhodopirellula rubra]
MAPGDAVSVIHTRFKPLVGPNLVRLSLTWRLQLSSKSSFQKCHTFFRAMCPKALTIAVGATSLQIEPVGIRLGGCWAHMDGSSPWGVFASAGSFGSVDGIDG